MKYQFVLVALAAGMLCGCATVFEGTSQEITVVTNPPGAVCSFNRQDKEVGRIENTPGTANIRKSKYDITIKCNKPGYAEAQYLNHSGTTATIAANVAADLILTAGLSSIVDSADGADNKYDSAVNISMIPTGATASPVPTALMPTPSAPSLTKQAQGSTVSGGSNLSGASAALKN